MSEPDPSTTLVDAARGFLPMLKERADEIESNRKLPDDIAASFAKSRFYALCVPKVYGGLEASPVTMMDVIETLATADASSAWCVFIGATSGLVAGYLPVEAAKEIYGSSSTVITGGVFAPRGKASVEEGGYRVSGQWQWGSGTQNADWIMGGCAVIREGQMEKMPSGIPVSRMMLVPAKQVEFLDTWHVSGLCGTGSTDFAFRELYVPEEHSVSLLLDKPLDGPLYAFPIFGMLSIGVGAVALGLARAAIDEIVALASEKTPEGSMRNLASRPVVQRDIAEAEALVRSARLFLWDSVARAYDTAEQTGALTVELRRDIRLAASNAATAGARAVDIAYNLGGGTSVYRSSPLQRYFRDVHTATQHMMVGPGTWEQTGRLYLGLETDTAML